MKKKKRVQPFDYLKNHVKFYLKRSNTHGVGLFALVDIKEGEEIFKPWEGETGIYSITYQQARTIPKTLSFVLKLFSNLVNIVVFSILSTIACVSFSSLNCPNFSI